MAPLDRAVALAQEHDVPVCVGEDLRLHVSRVLDQLLDVHRRVGEVAQPWRRAASRPALRSSALRTTFIPLPPPPAAALMISG